MRANTLTPKHNLDSEPDAWWTEAAYPGARRVRQTGKQPTSVRARGRR